ncbi:hypothetical protein [Mycolicibacterium sp. CH28]|uniref:hypothetical protein n=1 Tax=Mycolicibacterium sp. CH28 TaxID=2512237 RepID=UPI0013868E81|nr:hypothetical protein [Mycolicibacterium sp. CH28]
MRPLLMALVAPCPAVRGADAPVEPFAVDVVVPVSAVASADNETAAAPTATVSAPAQPR